MIRETAEHDCPHTTARDTAGEFKPAPRCPPKRTQGPLVTVIIPVFNEQATIDRLLGKVIATSCDKQIIVVDDGSTDDTRASLEKWQYRTDVNVIQCPVNRGKGAAIRTALPTARGDFTLIQDGDLETDPRDFDNLLGPLLANSADMVIGTRFSAGYRAVGVRATLHRLGVAFLNLIVRVLYGVHLSDEACGYKVMRTELLKSMQLSCDRFEFCPEVVAKACRMGLRICEVPVRYYPRSQANGKKIRYRDGFSAIFTLWRFRHWMPDAYHSKRQVASVVA